MVRMIQTGLLPNEVLNLDLTILEEEYCKKNSKFSNTHICAANKENSFTSPCFGDSGGPLISEGKQIGIASFIMGGCGGKYPGYYTNVYLYREWIQEISGCSCIFNLFGCCRIISIVLALLRYVQQFSGLSN